MNVTIVVSQSETSHQEISQKTHQISYRTEVTLLQNLLEQQILIPAVCAGNGTCGKCKVQFLEGALEATVEERNNLTEEEVGLGIRLACKCQVQDGAVIRVTNDQTTNMEIISSYEAIQSTMQEEELIGQVNKETSLGVAVDIGTTTIVMQLIDLVTGKAIQTYTAMNPQTQYGADVISRMKSSIEGNQERLQTLIKTELRKGIRMLQGTPSRIIKKVVIAANTTMIHLLMGYSCEGMSRYPFAPVNIATIETTYKELLGDFPYPLSITILPGISTFVGADITAGFLACTILEKEGNHLFLDLGTNGEMGIKTQGKLLVASTAAGPAFEGGNIRCGVGSIFGAICNVSIKGESTSFTTIGNQPPVGICGTGVMELAYELLKNGSMDETGLLADPYFEEGYTIANSSNNNKIFLEQADIRELQLAKAAIRAGMETLLEKCSLSWNEIDTIYLAGGFGYHLNLEKAVGIGLFPKEKLDNIQAVGNTSLLGAVLGLTQIDALQKIENMIAVATEITLSNEDSFEQYYLECMNF